MAETQKPFVVGETGGSETPTSCTFYSHFLPPSIGVPTSLFYFYCEMLQNIAKFFAFSPISLPLWESHFPPFLLLPPAPLLPPILPGSQPRVPLHFVIINYLFVFV